jgi:hypothetical protein
MSKNNTIYESYIYISVYKYIYVFIVRTFMWVLSSLTTKIFYYIYWDVIKFINQIETKQIVHVTVDARSQHKTSC